MKGIQQQLPLQQHQQQQQQNQNEFDAEESDTFLGFNRWNYEELPIQKHKLEILYSLENCSCLIVIAETGSGKTTKIPQFLFEAGYTLEGKRVAVTQPRRIAAMSVAKRVSFEMNQPVGGLVGYNVRFDNQTSEATVIRYFTDGMLINQVLQDPLLTEYSVVMVDDIHERTVGTDILLGLLKKIRRKRPTLKLIISSATLDAEKIAAYFEDSAFPSKILYIEGRCFPVDIYYLKTACKNYVLSAIQMSLFIHKEKKEGDILVFLTSQEEIEIFIKILEENALTESFIKRYGQLLLLPLYAALPLDQQMEVFKPITQRNMRKVIAATNIAESSITIPGVVYVVDCLHQKIKYFDHKRNFEALVVTPISRAAARQRAGRAGRVTKGECYRLCIREDFENSSSSTSALIIEEQTVPEILRCSLTDFVIQIKSLGVGDITRFDLLTPPSDDAIARSLETLFSLGVIDKQCNLTLELGVKIAEFQTIGGGDPRIGVMILKSFTEEFACATEILVLAAMLSVQGTLFYTNVDPVSIIRVKKKIGVKEGDHCTLINVYHRYSRIKGKNDRRKFCSENKLNEKSLQSAIKIHEQLLKQVKAWKLNIESAADDVEAVLRCIMSGFFANIAQRQMDGSYRNLRNKEVLYLHPQSILNVSFPDWVVYQEVVKTNAFYMREASEIHPSWILDIASHYYEDNRKKIVETKHGQEIIDIGKHQQEMKDQKKLTKPDPANLFIKRPSALKKDKPKLNLPLKSIKSQQDSVKQNQTLSFQDELEEGDDM